MELIALDPMAILKLDKSVRPRVDRKPGQSATEAAEEAAQAAAEAADAAVEEAEEKQAQAAEPRKKLKGRRASVKRMLRKRINIIDAKRLALRAKLDQEEARRKAAREGEGEAGGLNTWLNFPIRCRASRQAALRAGSVSAAQIDEMKLAI